MGTCNFINQSKFDLCVCECADDFEFDCIQDNFNYLINNLEKQFNRELQFFELSLKSGYYSGLQIFVELQDKDLDESYIEDLDNEETHYYFDMCRSEFLRKYKSEINFINKKVLPYICQNSGFQRIVCLGVFSSGEAIYKSVA